MLAAFTTFITPKKQIFSFCARFSFKGINHSGKVTHMAEFEPLKRQQWSENRQGDEFTCVPWLPRPLAML
jgi:hypothetical protein